MKRVVWLVLVAFCAAFGQVQAVDTFHAKAKPCPCCRPGACDTPGCCPLPASSSNVLESAPVAETARPPSPRLARLAHEWAQGCSFSFLALTPVPGQRPAPAIERARAATTPLFTAHCSRLI